MPYSLKSNAQQDDAEDHNWGSHVYWYQAGFGFETSLIVALISCACIVMDPVAYDLAQKYCDNGREIE